jgi:hypothetical protein
MNRIVLAAAALLTLAAPASAQFRGDYYGDRGYGGGGGWYDGRGPYGRRGYDPYDDDDRPRRYRRAEPPPYSHPRGGPPSRGAGGQMCVTPHGSCRQGVPVPTGTPCGCVAGGVTSRGFIR